MLEQRTSMDKHGRLLIPYQIRKDSNYKFGDVFIIRLIDNEMRIISLNKILVEARQSLKYKLVNDVNIGSVDDFIAERRSEAELENDIYNYQKS